MKRREHSLIHFIQVSKLPGAFSPYKLSSEKETKERISLYRIVCLLERGELIARIFVSNNPSVDSFPRTKALPAIHSKMSSDQANEVNTGKKVVYTPRADIVDLFARRFVASATKKAQKPLQQLCENLPSDKETVRKLPLYNSTFEAVQWQRDNYLVGKEYADARKLERRKRTRVEPPPTMPYDSTALGSMQIIRLGSWFIPSPTVKSALLPIVVSLPNGLLHDTILNATVNALPLAQPPLDRAVKYSMLQFMGNPHWREVIKHRTKGFIGSDKDSKKGGAKK